MRRKAGSRNLVISLAWVLILISLLAVSSATAATMGASATSAEAGQIAFVPIYFDLGSDQADTMAFSLQLIPNGSAPTPAVALAWQAVDVPSMAKVSSTTTRLSAAQFFALDPPVTGYLTLGYAKITIPATATPGNTYTIHMVNVGATYLGDEIPLAAGPDVLLTITGQHTLTVAANPTEGGTVDGAGAYDHGVTATVTATANAGWQFDNWSGDLTGSTNPATILMDANKSVTANFSRIQYNLTVTVSPSEGGSVAGGGSYNSGDTASLTATPNPGWQFDGWSGDLGGATNPASLLMSGPKSVMAYFSRITHTVTTTASPLEGGTVTGGGTYNEGDTATLTALPAAGWQFDHWSGDATGSANPTTIAVNTNKAATAHFIRITHTVNVTASPAEGGGVGGGGTYNEGETATVTATPNPGWQFDGWSEDLTGSTNPAELVVNANKSVTAHFSRITHLLTATADPLEGGSVTGAGTYNEGDNATVTALPQAGWGFDNWSGDLSGSTNPATILMSGNKSVTAHFSHITHTVTVAASPSEGGSVGGGGVYNEGDSATITATANPGWQFDGWSGDLSGSTNPTTITVDTNKSITAHFSRITHLLTATADPLEGGSVTGAGAYNEGDTATVTALPAEGWSFLNWSGDLSGATNPAEILMSANKSVVAHFARIIHTVALTASPDEGGTVSGDGTYNHGDTATISAAPNPGWQFDGWSGDLSGSANPAEVLVNGNKSITAHFSRITHTLATAASPSEGGSVTGGGTYNEGETATVTALPRAGWQFTGWSGDLSGATNPAEILMSANKSVVAHFARIIHTVALTASPDEGGTVSGDGTYNHGDTATISAAPNPGWQFDGWSGDLTGTVNPASVLVDGNKDITAHFSRITHTLTTAADPTDGGSVGGAGAYNEGDTATVTAAPNPGWQFDGWSGDLTGNANPAEIVINANKNVTAHFSRIQYSLTTAAEPLAGGTVGGAGSYNSGDSATVTATPAVGWEFVNWSGDLSGSSNPNSLLMDSSKSVTAHFRRITNVLTTAADPTEAGSVGGGGTYNYGETATVTATANVGWEFLNWSGDLSGSTNPADILIDGDKAVTANFGRIACQVTVSASPAEGGGVGGGGTYSYGDTASVSATTNPGWQFDGWSGDLTGTANPADVLVNGNKSITAHFSRITHSITTAVEPAGSGTVGGGGTYNEGDEATLTATPNAGWTFDHWSGDASGTINPTTIIVNTNKNVTAHFVRITHTVSTVANPVEGGSVTGGGTYNEGDTATLTALPAEGWSFAHWSGDLSGSTNPATISVTSNKSVTANFARIIHILTVSAEPSSSGTVEGGGEYGEGDSATVTAIPASGWQFDGWSGDLTGSTNPADLVVNANKSVTAHFSRITHSLATAASPVEGGTASGGGTYNEGDTATVTATPTVGWQFDNWSGDLTGSTNPADILMNTNKSVTAHFSHIQYSLAITTSPGEGGSVGGAGSYNAGDTATLTATPNAGWQFDGWTGDVVGTANPASLLMNGNKNVTAHFSRITHNVAVTASPSDGGSITGGGTHNEGDSATLTAIPTTGWQFDGWSGDLTGTTNPAQLLVNANKSVTAHFSRITHTLTTAANPAEGGSVDGAGTYNEGETATVTATPNSGWQFDNWSGDLSGTSNPATVTVNTNKSVTANFSRITHTVGVTASPIEGGMVGGGGTYNEGETATLTATPAAGWQFDGWSGDLSGNTNPAELVVNTNKSVTAHFSRIAHSLSVSADPSEGGTVGGAGTYSEGESATVSATANTGWEFTGWSGDLTGSANPTTILIDANKSVTAHFSRTMHQVTVSTSPAEGGTVSGSGSYAYGSTVPVSATANAGWQFVNWSGPVADANLPSTSVFVDGNKSVTANFSHITHNVTATASPSEGGSVSGGGTYNEGDTATLTATASAGWSFDHWSGDAGGTVNPTTVVVNVNKNVTANFVRITHTLTAAANPTEGGSVTGAGTYNEGDSATVTALPASGWQFDHWAGDLSGSTNPATVLMSGNKSVTAYFTRITHSVTVTASPSEGGTVGGGGTYNEGDTAQVSATPNPGWQFDGWSGDLTGTTNPADVLVNSNKNITAHFSRITHSLTTTANPTEGGSVSGAGTYNEGDTATVTATPNPGWQFTGWSGDLSGTTNPAGISMTANKQVTANFARIQHTLTVTAQPTEGGMASGGGVYNEGETVTVSATANEGWRFANWIGPVADANAATTTVVMSADQSVVAHFSRITHTLATAANPPEGGLVGGAGTYNQGDTATVTATPNEGWQFDNWSGDLSDTDNPCQIVMDADKSVTANFSRVICSLTAISNPAEGGSVAPTGSYPYGTVVSVTATANPGWRFDHWGGDAGGTTNPTSVTLNGSKSVTACFTRIQHTLTTAADPALAGSVSGGGTYNEGDTATVTAAAASGWQFSNWSGDLTGSANPASVVMSADKSVTAHFTPTVSATLGARSTTGDAGTTVRVPVVLDLGVISADRFAFSLQVNANGSAPALAGALGFEASASLGTPMVSPSGSSITVAWLSPITTPVTGSVTLGNLRVPVSGSATHGVTYTVHMVSVGSSLQGVEITTIAGADVLLTVNGKYNLSLSGVGSGTISTNGTSRSLPWTGQFDPNSSVSLQAVAASGWQFDGWSGDLSGSTNPTTLTMTSNKAVTATFARITHTMTVSASPVEGGSISGGGTYNEGDSATVRATPNPGWQFDGWSGDLTGTTNPASLAMDADKNVAAHFSRIQRTLVTTANPVGGGAVSGSGTYDDGVIVIVTATPSVGWQFDNWSGDLAGTLNPASVTMNAHKNVTANFSQIPIYSLNLSGVGSGTVNVNSVNHSLPWSEQFASGAEVTLEAVSAIGWQFTGWSGALSGTTNPTTVTIDATKNITATFRQDYLVGDVDPLLEDRNGDGDVFDIGEFGDNNLLLGDVSGTMSGWGEPVLLPPTNAVLFDAMDSYPVDKSRVRGGNGAITWGDLITTYDRAINPALARPRRLPLAGLMLAQPAVKTEAIDPLAAAAASGNPVVLLSAASGEADTIVRVKVTLVLARKRADRGGFCAALLPGSGVSDATIVGFEPAPGLPQPLVVQPDDTMLSVTWLDPVARVTGTVTLGNILVQIPADATLTDSWWMHLNAVGASLGSVEITPPALAGPDAQLTVVGPQPHDVAITQFVLPTSVRVSTKAKRLTATVANLTATAESSVQVRLLRNGVPVQSKIVDVPGMSSTLAGFDYVFSSADRPSVILTVEAILPADDDPANNALSGTVLVR